MPTSKSTPATSRTGKQRSKAEHRKGKKQSRVQERKGAEQSTGEERSKAEENLFGDGIDSLPPAKPIEASSSKIEIVSGKFPLKKKCKMDPCRV